MKNTEALIKSVIKKAMPHIEVDNEPVDLFFEFMAPKEKHEVYNDIVDGVMVKLPNFDGTYIKNKVPVINDGDVEDRDLNFVKRFINQKVKRPILDYNENAHEFELREKP